MAWPGCAPPASSNIASKFPVVIAGLRLGDPSPFDLVIPGCALLGADPESSAMHCFWIPGSLAHRQIDFVNFAQSSRPGMTV
jgi:hypothetical protein